MLQQQQVLEQLGLGGSSRPCPAAEVKCIPSLSILKRSHNWQAALFIQETG
jgi:hypothetical protein